MAPSGNLNNVLVVDDDKNIGKMIEINLKKTKLYNVSTVTSGEACLKKIQESMPDLILLDYKLPDMDGIEFLEARKDHADMVDIPVIFITGNLMPDHVKAYEAAGAIGVIPKPFDARTLAGVVETIWEQRPT